MRVARSTRGTPPPAGRHRQAGREQRVYNLTTSMIRILLLAMLAICSRFVLCGRFNLTRPADIVERFGFMDWSDKRPEPRFNIAPSQEILTIVQEPLGKPFAQTATWGLKPFWAKAGTSSGKKPPPINARAESLASSPMFREALLTGRCLIPATGFYEWRALAPT